MSKFRFLDADHPFFAPVWRRWATTLFPLFWGGVEFWHDSPGWGVLFVAAGAYAGYVLIYKGPSSSE